MQLPKVDKEVGKKGCWVPLQWSPALDSCFEALKRALAAQLELFQVEPDKPFRMGTDASNTAVGGGPGTGKGRHLGTSMLL